MPVNSVGALAKALSRWDADNPSGDAQSFVAWLSGLPQQVATSRGIDVPTRLFLLYHHSSTGEQFPSSDGVVHTYQRHFPELVGELPEEARKQFYRLASTIG